jgi:hypothetical protein
MRRTCVVPARLRRSTAPTYRREGAPPQPSHINTFPPSCTAWEALAPNDIESRIRDLIAELRYQHMSGTQDFSALDSLFEDFRLRVSEYSKRVRTLELSVQQLIESSGGRR